VAVSANQYFDLVSVWKCKQSFVKQGSKVHVAYQNGEEILTTLKQNLRELSSMKIVSSNLTVQLKKSFVRFHHCCPYFLTLNVEAIPLLQACIRAQKQRSFNKATGTYFQLATVLVLPGMQQLITCMMLKCSVVFLFHH